MSSSYYNEHNREKAAWLRELIKARVIAPGEVDERSIEDVRPNDLIGFDQCHFFAGIGVWSYALRLAAWPDDRPVWTGSCPCQPFSQAGQGAGFADERHLWPAWFHLIEECRPDELFGEQVASPDGLAWFDLVRTDLEGSGYACGAVDLCAAGVGAPQIRQRDWWIARLGNTRRTRSGRNTGKIPREESSAQRQMRSLFDEPESAGAISSVGNADEAGSQGRRILRYGADQLPAGAAGVAGFWRGADWIYCTDGTYRPVEPGTFPLAHGAPCRVGRLRGYGDAIVAQAAAEIIRASMSI